MASAPTGMLRDTSDGRGEEKETARKKIGDKVIICTGTVPAVTCLDAEQVISLAKPNSPKLSFEME